MSIYYCYVSIATMITQRTRLREREREPYSLSYQYTTILRLASWASFTWPFNFEEIRNAHDKSNLNRLFSLTLSNMAIGLVIQKVVGFLKILNFQLLFQELLNQYYACLYLSECISHADFKYSYEISKCWNVWQFLD